MMLGANVAVILAMAATGYCGLVNTAEHPICGVLQLTFPAFLGLNAFFLVFWVLVKLRYVLVPFLGFLACFDPVHRYVPINPAVSRSDTAKTLKVISFNVFSFEVMDSSRAKPNEILHYLQNCGADVICLQESEVGLIGRDKIEEAVKGIYPYFYVVSTGPGSPLGVLSKYPSLKNEFIEYESVYNSSCAFHLKIDNDTVVVINNHLESNHIFTDVRANIGSMVKGKLDRHEAKEEAKSVLDNLCFGNSLRAPQADSVAAYINRHSDKRIILCGDFNDTSLSYAHRILSDKLTDCFTSAGNGLGWTFSEGIMKVRIDHIMCSRHYRPVECRIDKSLCTSDHYPIVCYLEERKE